MWAFMGLLSIFSTIVFVVLGIISKLKKNKKTKRNFIVAAISFVIFIIAMIASPDTKTGAGTTVALETHETSTTPIVEKAPPAISKNSTIETPTPTPTPTATSTPTPTATPTATPIPKASPATKTQASSPSGTNKEPTKQSVKSKPSYDIKISFPGGRYPQTATHIKKAIHNGESAICTIDRKDADKHREESLNNVPTKKGFDRDEWPMAMCAEGGTGADIAYISPSDNRGAGSWVSHDLTGYSDGTRVLFVISGGKSGDIAPAAKSASSKSSTSSKPSSAAPKTSSAKTKSTDKATVYYRNCTAVRAAGKAPLYKSDPGYSGKLDRDGDGIACER